MHLFQYVTFPNFLIKYSNGQELNLQELKCINILKNVFDFQNEFFNVNDIKLLSLNYNTGYMQLIQNSLPSENYTYSNYTHGFSVNINSTDKLDKPFILNLYTKDIKDKISNHNPYAVTVFGQESYVHNITDNTEESMYRWLNNIPSKTVGRCDIIIPSVNCLPYFGSNVSFLKPFISNKVFNKLNDSQPEVLLARTQSTPKKIINIWEKQFIFNNYIIDSIKNCSDKFQVTKQNKHCSKIVLNSEGLKYSCYIDYNPYTEKSYVSLSNTNTDFPYIKRRFIGENFKDGDPIGFWIPQNKAVYSVQEGTVYPDIETFVASCGAKPCAIDTLLLDYEILDKKLPEVFRQ